MTSQKLLDYIRQQLIGRVVKENIKTALFSQGWSEQDIAEGFTAVEKLAAAPISQTPISSFSFSVQPVMPIQSNTVLDEKHP